MQQFVAHTLDCDTTVKETNYIALFQIPGLLLVVYIKTVVYWHNDRKSFNIRGAPYFCKKEEEYLIFQ